MMNGHLRGSFSVASGPLAAGKRGLDYDAWLPTADAPSMKPSTIETLVWVLLYGGLLILSLSVFIEPGGSGLAVVLRWLGGVAAVAGVLLIVLRSRMKTADKP